MSTQESELIDPDAICPVHRTPLDDLEDMELRLALRKALGMLSPRERYVVELHFGLNDIREAPIKEAAKYLGVCGARATQIFHKSLRKLKHPTRRKHIEDFKPTQERRRPLVVVTTQAPPAPRTPVVIAPEPRREKSWPMYETIEDVKLDRWPVFAKWYVSTFDTPAERRNARDQLRASKGWPLAYLTSVYRHWRVYGLGAK